jgi:hypothetical protein
MILPVPNRQSSAAFALMSDGKFFIRAFVKFNHRVTGRNRSDTGSCQEGWRQHVAAKNYSDE